MTTTDPLALIVAVIALAISIIAAGFTGWEAVTAHLSRTRPRPAAWVVSYRRSDEAWLLHNVGGSVASFVRIRIEFPISREGGNLDPYRSASVDSPVHPGQEALVQWNAKVVDPQELCVPSAKGGKSWRPLKEGEDLSDGRYLIAEKARVTWHDYRGRERFTDVRLR